MFAIENIKAGDEVVIRRNVQGRFQHYGYANIFTTVVRVTKSRIYVHGNTSACEFNKSDMRERGVTGSGSYNRRWLVADPAEIQKIRDEEAADKARCELERRGENAFKVIEDKFGHAGSFSGSRVARRTEQEIELLAAFAKFLSMRTVDNREALEKTVREFVTPVEEFKARVEGSEVGS